MRHLLALTLTAALLLSGCWSRKELQELSFVTAIGIDWNEETERLDLTVQIVRLLFVPRPGERTGDSTQERPYHFQFSSGRTTAEALNQVQRSQGRRLFFSHLQAVVFGSEMAERGIGESLNFLWRHVEVRPYADLAVVEGQARELLAGRSPQADVTGRWIVEVLEQGRAHGYSRSVTVLDAVYAMLEPGLATYLPVIRLSRTGSPDPSSAPDLPAYELQGISVFDQDRMIGFLSQAESRGVILTRGRARSIVVTVAVDGDSGRYASFAVREVVPELKAGPATGTGALSLTVRLAARGELLQQQRVPEALSPADVVQIEKAVAGEIRREVEQGIAATQRLRADVIGLAETLRQHNPGLWHRLMQKWDDHYAEVPVTVEVNVTLRRTGILR